MKGNEDQQDLIRQLSDYWQHQMTNVMTDREFVGSVVRMLHQMQGNCFNPEQAASAYSPQNAYQNSYSTPGHETAYGTTSSAPPRQPAAEHGAAVGPDRDGVDVLAARLAGCEARLAVLESSFRELSGFIRNGLAASVSHAPGDDVPRSKAGARGASKRVPKQSPKRPPE